MNLYVGNLSYQLSENELRQAFEEYGEVTSVRMITDRETGRPRGFGFVEMADQSSAMNAIDSLNSIENLLGKRLGTERWRGNLWIEGFDPFAELNWIGKTIRIGEAELVVREPIGRCAATSVDTDTGAPDIDMVRTLTEANSQPHFGVYAEVTRGALIAELAEITLSDTDAEAITP